MSYVQALKAAGAEVIEENSFGSYQGDWFALVRFNGETGWVWGSYGSCSGCDAFEAEFGFGSEDFCDAHAYAGKDDCPDCIAARADYAKRLAEFGRSYLDGIMTADAVVKQLEGRFEWDDESKEAAEWIRTVTKSGPAP